MEVLLRQYAATQHLLPSYVLLASSRMDLEHYIVVQNRVAGSHMSY